MKVAFFTKIPLTVRGGFEKILETVMCGLKDRGIGTLVVNFKDLASGTERKNLVEPFVTHRVIEIPFCSTLPFRTQTFKRLASWIGTYEYYIEGIGGLSREDAEIDVAIVCDPLLIIPTKRLLNLIGKQIPIIGWFHNNLYAARRSWMINLKKLLLRPLLKRQIREADGFIAISSGIERQIKKLYPTARVFTIFNPVVDPEMLGRQLIKKPQENILLYIGRLEDGQKNLRFLFRGLAKLNCDWKLKIIGEGPSEEELKRYARKMKIQDRIEWLGYQSEPFEVIKSEGATLLLLTSRFEELPTLLIEALTHGIPVLSSDCETGPEDIVIPGVNGYLYSEGDIKDFRKKLETICMGKGPLGTREQIQQTAKKFEVERNLDKMVETIAFFGGKKKD